MSSRRCPKCLAEVLTDSKMCPKCGAKLLDPASEGILRNIVNFSYIMPVYSKVDVRYDEEGTLSGAETKYRLYAAYREVKQPPFIIHDLDGYVNPKKHSYALKQIDDETLDQLLGDVPSHVWRKLMKNHNLPESDEDGEDDPKAVKLGKAGFIVTPVPILRDVNFLRGMDWKAYVMGLINYGGIKMDPRLLSIRRSAVMKGIKQAINPHGLVIFPGQTGKSDWFHYLGTCGDKVSANSLVGYADTDGPHPGSVDGMEEPFGIDQISSGLYRIFRYLLSLMELGTARVDTAAYPFDVQCLSSFFIMDNPIGDPKSDFAVLIKKMSQNPTLGRRFGIICYDKNAVRVERRERNLDVLMEKKVLLRAVEEYCSRELHKIIDNDKVWAWLNTRNDEFIQQSLKAIESLQTEDESLYLFLREFVENGFTHTRGGALRSAMVINLDKIALGEYNVDDLLSEAEEYLSELLDINFQSLQRISESYKQTKEEGDLRTFDALATYMKEIVSAVEEWRRTLSDEDRTSFKIPLRFYLNTLEYNPKSTEYFSQVLRLANRGNPEKRNSELKEHFNFEIYKEDSGLMCVVYSLEPMPHLKTLGSLDNLDNLTKFTEKNSQDEEAEPEKNLSPNNVKMSKMSKMSKTPLSGEEPPKKIEEKQQNIEGSYSDVGKLGNLGKAEDEEPEVVPIGFASIRLDFVLGQPQPMKYEHVGECSNCFIKPSRLTHTVKMQDGQVRMVCKDCAEKLSRELETRRK